MDRQYRRLWRQVERDLRLIALLERRVELTIRNISLRQEAKIAAAAVKKIRAVKRTHKLKKQMHKLARQSKTDIKKN